MDKLVDFLSGQFLLECRPNGGTAVLLRSLWVSLLFYLVLVPLKSYVSKPSEFVFSSDELRITVDTTLPWLGAIFAGVYAALYSRFAAQWAYLANLYNQLMAACLSMTATQRANSQALDNWRAAFIEDAQDLHLAGKSMFKSVIISLLQNGSVVRAFIDSTADGADRLSKLEKALAFSAAAPSPVSTSSITGCVAAGTSAPA